MAFEKPAHSTAISEDGFKHKYYNNGIGQPVYHAFAVPGTAVTTASWAIQKYTYDGNGAVTDIQWLDGNKNHDNTCASRLTGSFS